MENRELILETGLFSKLSEDKLNQLLSNIEEVQYPKNTVFIKEGERADACYIIKSGVTQVFTTNDEGKEVILARLEEGAYFGEQALLTENPGKRNASIRTVSDVTLIKITHKQFRDILEFDQELKERLEKIGHEQLLIKLEAQSAKFNLHKDLIGDINDYEQWKYDSEDVILQEGAPSDGVMFVLEGSVDVILREDDGSEKLISTVSAGNLLGELGVMTKRPRRASAVANGPVTIAFISNEKFNKLHDSNKDLQNMVSALKTAYQTTRRGRVIQYVGEFMGMDAITSTFRMPDGRQIFTARVIGKSIQSIRHMDMSNTTTYTYENGDDITRELKVRDGLLIGVTAYGEWDQLSSLYRMVFEREPISPVQIEQFKQTGDIEFEADEQTVKIVDSGKEIVCDCMCVSRNDISQCIKKGMTTMEQIAEFNGCGTVCASCTPTIKNMLGHDVWQAVKIEESKDLTDDTRLFRLSATNGQPLYHFKPGQHILVEAEVNGAMIGRAYSIASSNQDTHQYEIAVKKENGGLFSNWLFDQGHDHDILRVSEPMGANFIFETDIQQPAICFVNDIGVAPVMAFARSLKDSQKGRSLIIDYTVAKGNDFVFDETLQRLSETPNIELKRRITKHEGPITDQEIENYVKLYPDAEFFICGPRDYEERIRNILRKYGVTIQIERFASAKEQFDKVA